VLAKEQLEGLRNDRMIIYDEDVAMLVRHVFYPRFLLRRRNYSPGNRRIESAKFSLRRTLRRRPCRHQGYRSRLT
jgi:hypothetical protein